MLKTRDKIFFGLVLLAPIVLTGIGAVLVEEDLRHLLLPLAINDRVVVWMVSTPFFLLIGYLLAKLGIGIPLPLGGVAAVVYAWLLLTPNSDIKSLIETASIWIGYARPQVLIDSIENSALFFWEYFAIICLLPIGRVLFSIEKKAEELKDPSHEQDSTLTELITIRKQWLAKHITLQIDKLKQHSPLVPQECVHDCHALFFFHLEDIAEKTVDSEVYKNLQNHGYQDPRSGIYMVVSVLPWTTEEAILKLPELFDDKPFGYVAMMTKLFFNNWPAPDLMYFFHVLLCLGSNRIQMHTVIGHYGGSPRTPSDFIVYPVDLLNSKERQMINL